jgi:hypothetical protein
MPGDFEERRVPGLCAPEAGDLLLAQVILVETLHRNGGFVKSRSLVSDY